MLFNSGVFALFFAAFLPLYLLCRRRVALRNLLLIVASYAFYGWWDPRFLILVAVSTSVDYLAALGASGQPVRAVDVAKSAAYLVVVTFVSLTIVAAREVRKRRAKQDKSAPQQQRVAEAPIVSR